MLRAPLVCIAILGAAGLPTMASAAEQQTKITASVREVCRFAAPPLVMEDDGRTAFGQAFEACNSARSYNISAVTRQLEPGEKLVLDYGPVRHDLEDDGSTLLHLSRGPTFKIVDLRLQADALMAPVSVTFSMSAI